MINKNLKNEIELIEVDNFHYHNRYEENEDTRRQKIDKKLSNELLDYQNGRYTMNDVYKQIKAKTCPLSKRLRDYVLSHYYIDGNFLY